MSTIDRVNPFAYGMLATVFPNGASDKDIARFCKNQIQHMQLALEAANHIVVHLQSARGRELNGKRARLVGADPPTEDTDCWRVHALLEGMEKPMRLKGCNLVQAQFWSSEPSRSSLEEAVVRRSCEPLIARWDHFLMQLMLSGEDDFPREDVMERLNFLRAWQPGMAYACSSNATTGSTMSDAAYARVCTDMRQKPLRIS